MCLWLDLVVLLCLKVSIYNQEFVIGIQKFVIQCEECSVKQREFEFCIEEDEDENDVDFGCIDEEEEIQDCNCQWLEG